MGCENKGNSECGGLRYSAQSGSCRRCKTLFGHVKTEYPHLFAIRDPATVHHELSSEAGPGVE